MDQATWLKQKQENDVGKCAPPVGKSAVSSRRAILSTCRDLTVAEMKLLNKHFPNVIVYHAGLNSSQMDLSKMVFDLLVLDMRKAEDHLFLEVVSPSCTIPVIVLKKSFSNYKDLVAELAKVAQVFVISEVVDLDGDNFFLGLVKSKLPKLQSRIWTFLKKVFALLSK